MLGATLLQSGDDQLLGGAVGCGHQFAAAAPADRALLVQRTPLLPALRRVLEDSSNFDAEQCLRVLGAHGGDGSLAGGVAAVTAQLHALVGELPAELQVVDGSGLSRGNAVTPALLVTVLRESLHGAGGPTLLTCLPVGHETGTLERRFARSPVGARVHAKTGWIRGASALSGVLRLKDGGLRLFAILMRYDSRQSGLNPQLKPVQERMVEAIDGLAAGERRP